MPLFETTSELDRDADLLRRRRYGMIEVVEGRLARIVLRPWPMIPNWIEARVFGEWRHRWRAGKVCRLYYNHPRSPDNFLTLAYVQSDRDAGLANVLAALNVLDRIAGIKR